MEQEYIYAVARIKARELSLLTQQDLDRLMACKTPAECFRALADKGWGAGGETSAEAIFAAEEEKTWDAHEAIRPTDVTRTPAAVKEFLSRDQFRLPTQIPFKKPVGLHPAQKCISAVSLSSSSLLPKQLSRDS